MVYINFFNQFPTKIMISATYEESDNPVDRRPIKFEDKNYKKNNYTSRPIMNIFS